MGSQKRKMKEEMDQKIENDEKERENETIDEWPSRRSSTKRSSTKSRATNALEDARLREKAQEKELEALMVAVEAKRRELEKMKEVTAIHAERVERASEKSGSTSRRS